MKKFLSAVLSIFLLGTFAARAATITSQLVDPFGASNTVVITFKLKSPWAVPPNVVYTATKGITATNGLLSAQVGAGNYDVQVGPRSDLFAISVPTGNSTYDLGTLITNGLTFTFTVQPNYIQKAGDVMAGNLSFASPVNAGFILNSLTTTQRNALTGTNGMIVYDSTINATYIYANGSWVNAFGAAPAPALFQSDTNAFAASLMRNNNGFATNSMLLYPTNVQLFLDPTNIIAGAGTLTGTNGGYVFSISGSTFAGWHPGWNIAIGVAQWTVMEILDSTHVIVSPGVGYNGTGYTNAAYVIYPDAMYCSDITGVTPASWIGNDGSVGIVGQLNVNVHNSGLLYWANGYNSWQAGVSSGILGASKSLVFGSLSNSIALALSGNAINNSLILRDDSSFDVEHGLTNALDGILRLLGPVSAPGLLGTNLTTYAPAQFAGTGEIITTSKAVSGSNSVFTGASREIVPGSIIVPNGKDQGLVFSISSISNAVAGDFSFGTMAYSFSPYVTYAVQNPSAVFYGLSGAASYSAVLADGSLFSYGPNAARFTMSDGHEAYSLDNAAGAFGIHDWLGNSLPFAISNNAPSFSFTILTSGAGLFGQGLAVTGIQTNLSITMTPQVTKAANYTATATDQTIFLNSTTKTITLPTAAGIAGATYTVKLIAATTTGTVATTSAQTIDGASTYSLSAQYKYVTVKSDGANWWIVANN